MNTRDLRQRLGYTQEQMARACNVSVSTIRAWDQGARNPSGAALRLLQTLNAPPQGRKNREPRQNMPTVATVAGVKVMIFYNDHAPPHVHLSKGDMDVVVPIASPGLPSWAFTRGERREVLRWMKERSTALLAAWDRARAGESPGGVE